MKNKIIPPDRIPLSIWGRPLSEKEAVEIQQCLLDFIAEYGAMAIIGMFKFLCQSLVETLKDENLQSNEYEWLLKKLEDIDDEYFQLCEKKAFDK